MRQDGERGVFGGLKKVLLTLDIHPPFATYATLATLPYHVVR